MRAIALRSERSVKHFVLPVDRWIYNVHAVKAKAYGSGSRFSTHFENDADDARSPGISRGKNKTKRFQ
jgi:hypothetical protein